MRMGARPCGSSICLRRKRVILTTAFALLLAPTYCWPADSDGPGRKKAEQCQACHGLDGRATIAEAPNLAGQNEMYLQKALQDFKSGARKNEMMSIVISKLTDDDISDLAAYYSALPPLAGAPKQ